MKKLLATICLGALALTVATPATAQNSPSVTPIEALFGSILGTPSTLRRTPRAYYRPARLAQPRNALTTGSRPIARSQSPVRHAAAPRTSTKRATSRSGKNGLDPRYARQVVAYQSDYNPGTIIVDTKAKFLYLVQEDGMAMRYGVGVGRPGFEWSGTTTIKRKAEWPTWTPPAAMRKREPWLPVRMEGGIENPLGARAMYLYRGGKDTLYRLHGTNSISSIGQAVSSGCIRLMNDDIADLYERAKIGTKVVVI